MENQYPLPPPPEPQKSKRKVIIALSIVVFIIAAIILVTYVMAQSSVAAAASTFETSTQGFAVTHLSIFPPSVDMEVTIVLKNPSAVQFTVDRYQADVYVKYGTVVYSIGSIDISGKTLPPNGYVAIPLTLHCDSGVINFLTAHHPDYQVFMSGNVSVSGKYLFWTVSNSSVINLEPPTQTLTEEFDKQFAKPWPTADTAIITAAADPYANATKVLLQTSMGNITVELRNDMPITTGNFLNYVNDGKYNNTIFHRVIEGFIIQGGDLTGTGYGASTPIQDEYTTTNHNYNGTIGMGNMGRPNTAGSQFFINTADNSKILYQDGSFDSKYVAFGKVISGMDVVMEISHVPTGSNNRPLQDVTLISATVLS
jgi:peptidylprolyl isomerase